MRLIKLTKEMGQLFARCMAHIETKREVVWFLYTVAFIIACAAAVLLAYKFFYVVVAIILAYMAGEDHLLDALLEGDDEVASSDKSS